MSTNNNKITTEKKPEKTGFQLHPENINRTGPPLKEHSITGWFRGMMNSDPKVREALGRSILKAALDGDMTAVKLIWNYIDGMPKGYLESDEGGFGATRNTQINVFNLSEPERKEVRSGIRELIERIEGIGKPGKPKPKQSSTQTKGNRLVRGGPKKGA